MLRSAKRCAADPGVHECTASGTRRPAASVNVHLQAFLLDDTREFGGFRSHEIAELLRRAVIGSCAHGGDIAPGVFALQEQLDLLVEGVDDRGGRALWKEN